MVLINTSLFDMLSYETGSLRLNSEFVLPVISKSQKIRRQLSTFVIIANLQKAVSRIQDRQSYYLGHIRLGHLIFSQQ